MNLKLPVLAAIIVGVLPLAQSARAQDTSGTITMAAPFLSNVNYSGGTLVTNGMINTNDSFSSNLQFSGSITTSGSGGTLVLNNNINSSGGNLVLSNSPLTVGGTISTVNSGTLRVTGATLTNLNLNTTTIPSTPIITILPTVNTLPGTLTLSSTIFAPVYYLGGASINSNGLVNNPDLQALINYLRAGSGSISGAVTVGDSNTFSGLSDTMATGGTLTLLAPGMIEEPDGSIVNVAVPEPASVVLAAGGLATLLLAGRRLNGRRR